MTKERKTFSPPAVLTIAGSDPSGGAGIQADLKTFSAFGVYGMSVITAITVQNTCGVRDYFTLTPENVRSQLECVFEDISVEAVKTGMLVDKNIVDVVAGFLKEKKNLVIDPVFAAKNGTLLFSKEAISCLKKNLLPLARLVTPNTHEAALLAGMDKVTSKKTMKEAALRIIDTGTKAVLVKGGHLEDPRLFDILYDGNSWEVFEGKRIDKREPHGTGCTLSAAIAACLSKGKTLTEAVEAAEDYTRSAISCALQRGRGYYALLDHNVKGEWDK